MAKDKNGELLPYRDDAVYGNGLNGIIFDKYSKFDSSLFWYIISQVSERKYNDYDLRKTTYDFADIKKNLKLQSRSDKRLAEALDKSNERLLRTSLVQKREGKNEFYAKRTLIFSSFEVDSKAGTLTVAINEDAVPYLTNITKNFTQYSLQQLVKLHSKYSQTLFRLLNQFRSKGHYYVKRDKLIVLLGAPKSYLKSNISRFRERILDPSVKELSVFFENLNYYIKEGESEGRGRPRLEMIEFTFTPEPNNRKNINNVAIATDVSKKKKTTASNKRKEIDVTENTSQADLTDGSDGSSDTGNFIDKLL